MTIPVARLWVVNCDSIVARMLYRSKHVLSEDEASRSERFLFREDRVSFSLAHTLVRHALSEMHPMVDPRDWEFDTMPSGRPELAPIFRRTGLRFNLSHTRGLVGCVVTHEVDCGMDVEVGPGPKRLMPLARRCLAPAELDDLLVLPEDARRSEFLRYWTLKEAHAKATGAGLRLDFRTIPFELTSLPEAGESTLPIDRTDAKWHAWQVPLARAGQVAVCIRNPRRDDRPMRLEFAHNVLPRL